MRQEIRIFALSRIQSAKILENQYQLPKDFDIQNFLKQHFQTYFGDQLHHFKIVFNSWAKDFILEKEWFENQKTTENSDGTVTLEFDERSVLKVKIWVLGWAEAAQVIEPEILIQEIREHAKKIGELYKAS